MDMFCTNCGQPAPDGAKFCPECGAPLALRPLVNEAVNTAAPAVAPEPPEVVPEIPAATSEAPKGDPVGPEIPAATPEAPKADPVGPEIPKIEAEPVSAPKAAPTAAVVSIAEEPPKGLHFTATVAILLTSAAFVFGSLVLLGLMIGITAELVILFATLTLLLTPVSFGFGVAAFIVGLHRKRTGTWVIGLIAALLAVLQGIVSVIYLLAGIIYAVV